MFKEGIAKFLKLDSLMENLTGYVETRIELLKYDLKEDLARTGSKVFVYLVLAMAGLFFLMFLSVAIALQIGVYLGLAAGFGIVAVIYALVTAAIFYFRDSVGNKVEREIRSVMKQNKK